MSSAPMPPAQVTYVTQGNIVNVPSNEGAEKYASTFYKLGLIQTFIAALCLTLGIAILAFSASYETQWYDDYYYYDVFAFFGTGIWTSAFFFTSGILGIFQGKKKTRCLLIAALTMTIFSALAAATLFGMELTGALIASNYLYDYDLARQRWNVSLGIHSTLCFLGFAELVTSIVHSAFCCGAHCCQSTSTNLPSTTTYAYVNPGQVTTIPGQIQPTFVQGAPIATGMPGQMVQQPVFNYQAPVQGGFVAAQPNVYQPVGTTNHQPPPAYQHPTKA